MSLETQIPTFPHTVKFSFCCPKFLRIQKCLLPLLMVDTLALGVLEFDAGVTVVFEILGALVVFAFEASTSCIQHIKSNTNCSR